MKRSTRTAAFAFATAVTTLGMVTSTAFVVQAGGVALGRVGGVTPMLAAVGISAFMFGAALLAVAAARQLPEEWPTRLMVVTAVTVSGIIAIVAWIPDALRPSSLGRLQWALIVAGVVGSFLSLRLGAGAVRIIQNWASTAHSARRGDAPSSAPVLTARMNYQPEPVTVESVGSSGDIASPGTASTQRENEGHDPLVSFAFVSVAVLLTFLARYLLSGWNSYWYDELISVELYLNSPESALSGIWAIASSADAHPPLYQYLLYVWVLAFGDGEVATRTLSNVFMTAGVILVYPLTKRLFGRVVASAATLTLAITHTVMFYGMETRSYGQSFMLAVLSSLGLVMLLERFRSTTARTWSLLSWPALLLCSANIALLLTHYFNFFFWGTQAAFMAGYLLVVSARGVRTWNLVRVGVSYVFQLGVFLVVWGSAATSLYERTGPAADSSPPNPLTVLLSVAELNFRAGRAGVGLVLALVAGVLLWMARDSLRHRGDRATQGRLDGIALLSVMTLGPPLLAFATFGLIQQEVFRPRYMTYLVPGLTILVTLAGVQAVRSVVASIGELFGSDTRHRIKRYSVLYAVALLSVLVLPGTMAAANHRKDDWRGLALQMATISRANPAADYIILEPAHRETPLFDYYLRRFSADLLVAGTIRRVEERRGEGYAFEEMADFIAGHDFLMVPFAHQRTTHFPVALERLSDSYEVYLWQINRVNKGLVIFDLRSGRE